jgi:hypothetical protein
VFINTYYTGKLFGLSYKQQFKDYIPYFIKSAISCLPAYLLTFLPISSYIQLSFGVIISTALYYIILRKDEYMVELIAIAKSKLWKRKNND